ncbi:MAG: glycosyltransferase family 4 protein [Cyclobacteriaceae bacterium]
MTLKDNNEILFITHKYPPSIGGMQKQSYELISNLSSLQKVHTIILKEKTPKLLFLLSAWIRAVWLCTMNHKIKIVHANDGLMAMFISPLLILRNVRITATVHGLDVVFPFFIYQWWIRNILSKFDLVITVSRETREECIKRNIQPEKVRYIANGNSFKNMNDTVKPLRNRPQEPFIITSIGRAIPRKGFSWFLESVIPLIKHPVEYHIAGSIEKKPRLIEILAKTLPPRFFTLLSLMFGFGIESWKIETLLKHPNLRSKVKIHGGASNAEIKRLLNDTTLFIMPNMKVEGDYEGFGLVTHEAISQGCLCLASEVDGIPSAISNEETGYLLPERNEEMWAKKINDLLLDSDSLREINTSFRENLENNSSSWKEMSTRYLQAFNSLMDSKNSDTA